MSRKNLCEWCTAGKHDHVNGERCMHLALGTARVSVCTCKTA